MLGSWCAFDQVPHQWSSGTSCSDELSHMQARILLMLGILADDLDANRNSDVGFERNGHAVVSVPRLPPSMNWIWPTRALHAGAVNGGSLHRRDRGATQYPLNAAPPRLVAMAASAQQR